MPTVILLHDALRTGALGASLCKTGHTVLAELDQTHALQHEVQRPIIEAACARFEAMKHELASTRAKLAERKLIEKAKGIVMAQRKLSEDEAYGAGCARWR